MMGNMLVPLAKVSSVVHLVSQEQVCLETFILLVAYLVPDLV